MCRYGAVFRPRDCLACLMDLVDPTCVALLYCDRVLSIAASNSATHAHLSFNTTGAVQKCRLNTLVHCGELDESVFLHQREWKQRW